MKENNRFFITVVLIFTALTMIACPLEASYDGGTTSVSFSDVTKSIVAVSESFEKGNYYWKYACRKNSNLPENADTRINYDGQTASYDEDGSVFVHEDYSGLDGTIDGFTEGIWDFMLFGYRRTGKEGSYSYDLVYCGESTGIKIEKDKVNTVAVVTCPVTDHGNGSLCVNPDDIIFRAKEPDSSEIGDFLKAVTVTRLEDMEPVISESCLYDVQPGAYLVTVTFSINGYVYAEGSVVANVFSNQTVKITGRVDELMTFVALDIPKV